MRIAGLALLAALTLGCRAEERAPRLAHEPATRALEVTWVGEPDGDGPLLVLLHGYGAPGDDLVPLGRALAESVEGLRVVLPIAPLPRPPSGRAWWPLDLGGPRPADRSEDEPRGLPSARRDVIAFMEGLRREGQLDPSRTVIAGFSQGGMLAIDVALEWDTRVAGAATLSGGALATTRFVLRARERTGLPLFASHGRHDPLLAFESAEQAHRRLAAAGAELTFEPFDGGHAIPPSVVDALRAWLDRVLSAR